MRVSWSCILFFAVETSAFNEIIVSNLALTVHFHSAYLSVLLSLFNSQPANPIRQLTIAIIIDIVAISIFFHHRLKVYFP